MKHEDHEKKEWQAANVGGVKPPAHANENNKTNCRNPRIFPTDYVLVRLDRILDVLDQRRDSKQYRSKRESVIVQDHVHTNDHHTRRLVPMQVKLKHAHIEFVARSCGAFVRIRTKQALQVFFEANEHFDAANNIP